MKLGISLALSVLVASACASRGVPAMDAGDLAPFPYTADQIREANPPGTTMVFRVRAVSQPTMIDRVTFVEASADRTVIETERTDTEGNVLRAAARDEVGWKELQEHASFAADATERSRSERAVGAGSFDCWLYTVRTEGGGHRVTQRYWFALEKPGAPVYFETEVDGKRVMSSELVELRMP